MGDSTKRSQQYGKALGNANSELKSQRYKQI